MLEELKTFIAVVEYENFTKAGEKINLSQPSVSVHIKHLEEYFNTTLIKRSIKQKNIFITEQGKLLYRRAKDIVKILDNTKEELKNYSESIKGHLTIGASFTIGEYFLPDFLGKFSKEFKDIEIEMLIENTSSVCNKVKNLKIDVGLIEGVASSFEFNQDYFLEDELVLVVPYNDPLTKEEFSIEKLQNHYWISREKGSGTREYLNMFLTCNEIIPLGIMVLGSNYAVKEAVKNNLGITIISNFVVEEAAKNKEVSIIKLDDNYKRHFSYILPKDLVLSKVTNAFIKSLSMYKRK